MTTAMFSRPYMRIEEDHGRLNPGAAAPLSQHVPAVRLHDAARAAHQQHGHRLGRDRGGHAGDGAARQPLPHAGEPGGGVEVLHPVRRRHRAGAVRHDPALHGVAEDPRQRHRGAALDASRGRALAARADRAVDRVRVPARRLRHQGRAGAAPQLAARRARRRPDAGVGGALGVAAQRRALRARALQGARRRRARHPVRRQADDGLRHRLGRGRGVLPLAPARHQASLRLLLDRAHGAHHLRVRHGRPGRELRRAPAHDGALAHQERDLLRRRPRGAEDRHAGHGGHPRPDAGEPDASAGG